MNNSHDLIRNCEMDIQQFASEIMAGGLASDEDRHALHTLHLCLRALQRSCPSTDVRRSQMALYKPVPNDPLIKLVQAVFGSECGFVFIPFL